MTPVAFLLHAKGRAMLPRRDKQVPESTKFDAKLHALREIPAVLRQLTDRLFALGYAEMEIFNIRLAVEEALVNAIRHGHNSDPSRAAAVSYLITPRHILIRVQDEGDGFDPYQLPDPAASENLDRETGRGIYLMKATMTWVKYNAQGNCVTLFKKRM
jgi:serine/threonine-protein kinase RsbW